MSKAAPPKLGKIQGLFFDLVRRPLAGEDRLGSLPEKGRLSRRALREMIKPNDRLTAEERLEIYARQYWFRVMDSLIEDFPGVRAILGPAKFDRLLVIYLEKNPSRSFTMRNLGEKFPAWLARQPGLRHGRNRAAVDMARLEWAKIEAFDAAEFPPLDPGQLQRVGRLPARLLIQPYIHLLRLDYPVDEWLAKLNREEWRAEASNAVDAARNGRQDAAAPGPLFRKKPVYVAVHRHNLQIYFKRLAKEELALLQALQRGVPFQAAVASVARTSRHGDLWWSRNIEQWFGGWTALGWLASSKPKTGKY